MDRLPELRSALGLSDDASIDDVLAKITELTAARQSANPDPSKYVPIGDFERAVTEVNRLNQGLSLQAATVHVTDQIERNKLLPWMKDWGIALCSVNKPAFDAFVAKTGGQLQALLMPSKASSAFEIDPASTASLTDGEIAIASNMGLSAEDFAKTKSLNSRQDNNR